MPAPTSSTSAAPPAWRFPALGDVVRDLVQAGMRVSVDSFDPGEIRTAVAAGAELVLSVNGSNIDVARDLAGTGARVVVLPDLGAPARDARAEPGTAGAVGRALSDRPDPRADRLRLHGFARALRRGAAPLPGRRDADGHRQPDRADRGRYHRRQRAADRDLPGAGHPRRADDRGHPVGARRRPRDRRRPPADALRRDAAGPFPRASTIGW